MAADAVTEVIPAVAGDGELAPLPRRVPGATELPPGPQIESGPVDAAPMPESRSWFLAGRPMSGAPIHDQLVAEFGDRLVLGIDLEEVRRAW